jgi:hypothetical protein
MRLSDAAVEPRWVSSEQEFADGLTKPWTFDQLLRALNLGVWSSHFDPLFVSA